MVQLKTVLSVKSSQNDTDGTNNNATSQNVTAVPVADLEITKTVNTTSQKVGNNVVYTIHVKNNGPSTATDVKVVEKLSDMVKFISASGNGKYDNETGIWSVGNLTNQGEASIEITVKLIKNGTVENNVVVYANENDTDDSNNNVSSENVTARPVVNLIANITVNDTTPTYGEDIKFVVEITNEGPNDANNVVIREVIPEGLTNVEVTVNMGNYDPDTRVWTIDKVKVAEIPVLVITATVETLHKFNGSVDIVSAEDREDNLDDNQAVSDDVIPQPLVDVEVEITVDKSEVNYGDVVEFIITVKNNGPNDASEVTVENIIPKEFEYVSDNLSDDKYDSLKELLRAGANDPTYDASTGVWYIGDLAKGDSVKLAILARAKYLGTKDVISTVTSYENETDESNNNDSASVTVKPVADLKLEVSVDKTKVKVGDEVTYTFTVTNNGPNDASDVKVTDSAITEFEFVSASSDDYDSKTGVWTIGDLKNGSSVTLTVTVVINKAGVYHNSAYVEGNETDSNMSDNNASADDVEVEDIPAEAEDDDVVENENVTADESISVEKHAMHETGNPVFMALAVLIALIILPLRRRI